MGLNFVALLFDDAAKFALHGFERVMDDFLERFVSAVIHLPFIGHKLVPRRHGHVDADAEWVSFLMGVVRLLDGNVAAVDVVAKLFKARCFLKNELIDVVGFGDTAVGDIDR